MNKYRRALNTTLYNMSTDELVSFVNSARTRQRYLSQTEMGDIIDELAERLESMNYMVQETLGGQAEDIP